MHYLHFTQAINDGLDAVRKAAARAAAASSRAGRCACRCGTLQALRPVARDFPFTPLLDTVERPVNGRRIGRQATTSATTLRPGLSARPRADCTLPGDSTAVHRHADPLSAHAEPAHDVLLFPLVPGTAALQASDANRSRDGRFCGRLPAARLPVTPGTRSPSRIDTESAPRRRTVSDSDHPTGAAATPPVPQLTDGPNSGKIPAGPPARDPMHKGRRLLPRRSRPPHPSAASGSVGASADRHRVWERSITNCACRGRRRRKQPPNALGPRCR